MRKDNPSLCAYCRTPLSSAFIKDYSFVDVNLKNLDNIEIEDLQNCFPILPLLPETTRSDILRWLSKVTKDNRIDINFICPLNGGNILFAAALSGNFDIIKFLVEQGVNSNYVNKEGTNALHYATKHNIEIIEFFLQLGSNINQNGESGTPLYWATRFGNAEAVEYLILKGANVNLESFGNDKIPLIASTCNGNLKIVRLLLEGGAEIDCNSESFGTPLSCAVENGHLNVVEYLIKEKADINLGTMEDGHTPLMLATMENNLKIPI